jgi:hypothetical protein
VLILGRERLLVNIQNVFNAIEEDLAGLSISVFEAGVQSIEEVDEVSESYSALLKSQSFLRVGQVQ